MSKALVRKEEKGKRSKVKGRVTLTTKQVGNIYHLFSLPGFYESDTETLLLYQISCISRQKRHEGKSPCQQAPDKQ